MPCTLPLKTSIASSLDPKTEKSEYFESIRLFQIGQKNVQAFLKKSEIFCANPCSEAHKKLPSSNCNVFWTNFLNQCLLKAFFSNWIFIAIGNTCCSHYLLWMHWENNEIMNEAFLCAKIPSPTKWQTHTHTSTLICQEYLQ